nr:hypothetical protein [Kibdelosporangium sp. MJ126-NF4]CEL20950.1 hypothetical protein [Kibdelosporangium sp. MJ126-NF4]CTQ95536.1 hypothetical protein [Kibdelosporangium sp. MJ126-NF4]
MDTMRADARQLTGVPADWSTLVGSWVNSNPSTEYITRVEIAEPTRITCHGMNDWGTVTATPYVASGTTTVAGFHARYVFGNIRTELAANEKFGILVIQSYTSFTDGRLGHYSREFFHRADAQDCSSPDSSTQGCWVNSNPATEWITGFTLDGSTLRVTAANDPTDWGTTEATLYMDNLGEPAFHAVHDLGAFSATLAANTNKGLTIIAAFLDFKGKRENHLCREFYFRPSG